ncbi:uncharacterized protein LOC5507371 [Nematostella vectensis]|uniref:uncharacterized protein LOC5507371 n=1 Tax=Nematostella vectensis TaxID=45351 RepID=UPI0020775CC8|nr:uncharacterized protein LOC5507371 [Nematostella vectensis]
MLPSTMVTIKWLVMIIVLNVCFGQDINVLEVSLLDDADPDAEPTVASSTSEPTSSAAITPFNITFGPAKLSEGQNGMGGNPAACRKRCPSVLNIGWLDRPPLIYNGNNASEPRDDASVKVVGIFPRILQGAINICCSRARMCGQRIALNFSRSARNALELDRGLIDMSYDFILPVDISDGETNYGSYPYIHVLSSPGLMLICHKQRRIERSRVQVLKILQNTWPVVVVTFLLTACAGITIWALDSTWNPLEFPPTFVRGVLEGCWWAFVTMTTVGYGDRAPKSHLGRVFGVIWITVGLVICSFLTATLTSALTSISVRSSGNELLGRKIGVVNNAGHAEAVSHGAVPFEFASMEEAYHALVDHHVVDMVLFEIHAGEHFMSSPNRYDNTELLKVIKWSQSIGFAHYKYGGKYGIAHWDLRGCLGMLMRYRRQDITVIVDSLSIKDKPDHGIESENLHVIDPNSENVRSFLLLLSLTVGLMCMLGVVYEIIRRWIAQDKSKDKYCVNKPSIFDLIGKFQKLESSIHEFREELTIATSLPEPTVAPSYRCELQSYQCGGNKMA